MQDTNAPDQNPNGRSRKASPVRPGPSPSRAPVPPKSQTNTCSRLTPQAAPPNPDDTPARLAECEQVAKRYAELSRAYARLKAEKELASLPAGRALLEIKADELFKNHGFDKFNKYVKGEHFQTEVGIGVRRVQQLISAVKTVERLRDLGVTDLPRHEGQARPLTSLSDGDLTRVWRAVLGGPGLDASKSDVKLVRSDVLGEPSTEAARESRTTTTASGSATPPTTDRFARLTAGWSRESVRALAAVPEPHRPSLAAVVARDFDDEHVTPELVAEAADGYASSVLEDGADPTPPDQILTELHDEVADTEEGTAEAPIADLVVLDGNDTEDAATACATAEGYAARRRSHRLFLGTTKRRPTLVALPTGLVPTRLLDDVPANVRTEGASEVVVEIGELERAGGPVRGGVLDLEEIFAFLAAYELSFRLNRTNEHVDWARYTSNPLTGCWHLCRNVFCYAAGIARRQCAQGFLPSLYPARLKHLANEPVPDVSALDADEAWRERSVFMVSMGDLFGGWVPEWFVEAVLEEVRAHPEWFVFFLTKDPRGLDRFTFPSNSAVGLTLTGDEPQGADPYPPERRAALYRDYAAALARVRGAAFTWLSIEPFRGDVGDLSPFFDAGVQMVAIGGQTKTIVPARRGGGIVVVPELQPEVVWLESVRAQCRAAGVALFEKENLTVRPKEIPFPAGKPTS